LFVKRFSKRLGKNEVLTTISQSNNIIETVCRISITLIRLIKSNFVIWKEKRNFFFIEQPCPCASCELTRTVVYVRESGFAKRAHLNHYIQQRNSRTRYHYQHPHHNNLCGPHHWLYHVQVLIHVVATESCDHWRSLWASPSKPLTTVREDSSMTSLAPLSTVAT